MRWKRHKPRPALEEAAENAQAADKAETFFRGKEGPVVDADAHPVEDEK